MNKQDRKEKLREIYYLLNRVDDNSTVLEAKQKVAEMLAGHGIFMLQTEEQDN